MDCTEATISQHYYWPNIRDDIRTQIKFSRTCQRNNKRRLKQGYLPDKEAEAIPGDKL